MIFSTLFQFFKSIATAGSESAANYALFLVLLGSAALSLFALVFRLITRIKSFALFGG